MHHQISKSCSFFEVKQTRLYGQFKFDDFQNLGVHNSKDADAFAADIYVSSIIAWGRSQKKLKERTTENKDW